MLDQTMNATETEDTELITEYLFLIAMMHRHDPFPTVPMASEIAESQERQV